MWRAVTDREDGVVVELAQRLLAPDVLVERSGEHPLDVVGVEVEQLVPPAGVAEEAVLHDQVADGLLVLEELRPLLERGPRPLGAQRHLDECVVLFLPHGRFPLRARCRRRRSTSSSSA
jgi:hypothetical protein